MGAPTPWLFDDRTTDPKSGQGQIPPGTKSNISALVRQADDQKCIVTHERAGLDAAHLVPASEEKWVRQELICNELIVSSLS